MTPTQLLKKLLADSGLHLATYSPCDGATRYRFFPSDERGEYFASSSELFTAIGRREAITFLQGYRCAQMQVEGQRIAALHQLAQRVENVAKGLEGKALLAAPAPLILCQITQDGREAADGQGGAA